MWLGSTWLLRNRFNTGHGKVGQNSLICHPLRMPLGNLTTAFVFSFFVLALLFTSFDLSAKQVSRFRPIAVRTCDRTSGADPHHCVQRHCRPPTVGRGHHHEDDIINKHLSSCLVVFSQPCSTWFILRTDSDSSLSASPLSNTYPGSKHLSFTNSITTFKPEP